MICKVCGRNIANEEANFCEYCGASFRPGTDNKVSEGYINQNIQVQRPYLNMEYEQKMNQEREKVVQSVAVPDKTMSFGDWMLSYVLLFVPYVGIGFLFFWAFGKSTPPTKKNWARVMLILMGIAVILMFGVMSAFGGSLSDPTALLNSLYGQ